MNDLFDLLFAWDVVDLFSKKSRRMLPLFLIVLLAAASIAAYWWTGRR